MSAFTLRYNIIPNEDAMRTVEALGRRHGARVAWGEPSYGRRYALIEPKDPVCLRDMREAVDATVYEGPIIALAVSPSVSEALFSLTAAFGGPGRPQGVIDCEAIDGALILEWDLDRTAASVILGIVDVEIDRFHARRVNALLTPLPLAWWAGIASDGLQAPEIAPDRVIEALLEDAHVAG